MTMPPQKPDPPFNDSVSAAEFLREVGLAALGL